jgi:hypothetical protein
MLGAATPRSMSGVWPASLGVVWHDARPAVAVRDRADTDAKHISGTMSVGHTVGAHLVVFLGSSLGTDMDTGFSDLPRAMLSAAVGMIDTVERVVAGDRPVRTSRGNAWEAVLADRARADRRDSVRRQVASLVGSSPRSSASQASVVVRGVERS